jgi:hypothetical protein
MGFVGSLFGGTSGNSGGAGINYNADLANVKNPVTQAQIDQAQQQAQQGIGQQQNFLNALQSQNGIGNQSAVFNQLQNIANGTGPNPAQAMLNQQTGQNIQNQAALMAGQRGAGANAGLIARQAAQQGGALQQNAIGQGASMQAQQSLGALNQLGGIAGQQVGQQAGALQNLNQGIQSEQSQLLGAQQGYNNAQVGSQSSVNSANSGVANTVAGQQGKLLGGALQGIGGALGLAGGGEVPRYAFGVDVPQITAGGAQPTSRVGGFLSGWAGGNQSQQAAPQIAGSSSKNGEGTDIFQGGAAIGSGIGKGLKAMFGSNPNPSKADMDEFADASVPDAPSGSTGVAGLGSVATDAFAMGGKIKNMKKGGHVPGKAKVKGDSYTNDTVDAKLSPGEIVLPRTIAQHPNAAKAAAAFVAALKSKQGLGR